MLLLELCGAYHSDIAIFLQKMDIILGLASSMYRYLDNPYQISELLETQSINHADGCRFPQRAIGENGIVLTLQDHCTLMVAECLH